MNFKWRLPFIRLGSGPRRLRHAASVEGGKRNGGPLHKADSDRLAWVADCYCYTYILPTAQAVPVLKLIQNTACSTLMANLDGEGPP